MKRQFFPAIPPESALKKAVDEMGFQFIAIWGIQGSGKSTFALHLLNKIYNDWDQTLKHICFDIPQFDKIVDHDYSKYGRCKGILWDDMGMFQSRYSYLTQENKAFMEEWTAIRPKLAVFLATCVQLADLPKFLRFKLTGEIVLLRRGEGQYLRYVWRPHFKKAGDTYFMKPMAQGVQFYPLPQDPKDIYGEYFEIRKENLERKQLQRKEITLSKDRIEKVLKELFIDESDAVKTCWEALKNTYRSGRSTRKINKIHEARFGEPIPTTTYKKLGGLGIIHYRPAKGGSKVELTELGRRIGKYFSDHEKRMLQQPPTS